MEGGRFLPPEVGSKIKEKAELTPQEKEILKKVSFQNLSVKYIVTSMVDQQKESSRFKQGCTGTQDFCRVFFWISDPNWIRIQQLCGSGSVFQIWIWIHTVKKLRTKNRIH